MSEHIFHFAIDGKKYLVYRMAFGIMRWYRINDDGTHEYISPAGGQK